VRCGKLGVWVFSRFIVLADLLNSIRSSTVFTSLGSFCSEYLKISATLMISFALMLIFRENFVIIELLMLFFSLSILWIVYKKYTEIRI